MKIALAGNQNSGKTTLFNLLTGSNQKIGSGRELLSIGNRESSKAPILN